MRRGVLNNHTFTEKKLKRFARFFQSRRKEGGKPSLIWYCRNHLSAVHTLRSVTSNSSAADLTASVRVAPFRILARTAHARILRLLSGIDRTNLR